MNRTKIAVLSIVCGVFISSGCTLAEVTTPAPQEELEHTDAVSGAEILVISGTTTIEISGTGEVRNTFDFVASKALHRPAARVDTWTATQTKTIVAQASTFWSLDSEEGGIADLEVVTGTVDAVAERSVGTEYFDWVDIVAREDLVAYVSGAPVDTFQGVPMSRVVDDVADFGGHLRIWIDPVHYVTLRQETWDSVENDYIVYQNEISSIAYISNTSQALFAVPTLVAQPPTSRADIIPGKTVTEYGYRDLETFDRFDIYDFDEPSITRDYSHRHVVSSRTQYNTPRGKTNEFELFLVTGEDVSLEMRPTSGFVPDNQLSRQRGETVGVLLDGVYGELYEDTQTGTGAFLDVTLGNTWIRILAPSKERAEEVFYDLRKVN